MNDLVDTTPPFWRELDRLLVEIERAGIEPEYDLPPTRIDVSWLRRIPPITRPQRWTMTGRRSEEIVP